MRERGRPLLSMVATLHHTTDLLPGERFDVLSVVTDQPHTADATAISEDDMPAILVQLPSRGFVFHTAVVLLKTRIALLPRLPGFALLIET